MMTLGDTIDVQDLPPSLLTEGQPGSDPAARTLRIGRDALRYKLKKHNL
jgi:hypothetical protein